MTYKLQSSQPNASIIRLADNAYIPQVADNIDYQAYLSWLAEGNTPTPPDQIPNPAVTSINAQIADLELSQHRAQREVTVAMYAKQQYDLDYQTYLTSLTTNPQAKPPTLPPVPTYSINKLHAIDAQVTALRDQLKTLPPLIPG